MCCFILDHNSHVSWGIFTLIVPSDVKRGQNLEAEARTLRPRPRPELWGQGRGRGQFFEVEAKTEAKDKVMNKKYQMMVDNKQVNLYHCDQNDTVYFSFSLAQWLSSIIVWCPVVGKQIGQSISSWLLVLLLQTEARPRPNVWGQGRGQSFEAEAEAKILASRT